MVLWFAVKHLFAFISSGIGLGKSTSAAKDFPANVPSSVFDRAAQFSRGCFSTNLNGSCGKITLRQSTRYSLVFGWPAFPDDSAMPSRKPEFCPHRRRLGKNVASLRARRDLTQEKLAEIVGVSARYNQNVEAGDNFPSLPALARLRAVLRCDWNELFAGCDEV